MSEVENLKTIETLDRSPFKHMVATIGNLPTSFVDSMSYYECIAWLVKYLETEVIPTVNNNAGAVAELQAAYIQLKEFVDNYFENLDVQEEINNKLDAMAESGTLAELINDYLSLEYIFPKRENETYSTWGDITIIKFNNKILCIDTGLSDRWNEIHLMLYSNGITHIDNLMITHYHDDHIGNLENLITDGYVDSETDVYLCGDVTNWVDIVTVQTYVKTLLDNNDITYRTPSESEIVNYYGLKLQFNNTENLDSLYYSYNDYNACSMIISITYKNHKSIFSGDATNKTLEHIYSLGVADQKVDLYKVGHHAIGQYDFMPFIEAIHPNIVVVIASPTDSSRQINSYNQECEYVQRYGGLIYTTFSQEDYLKFVTDGNNAVCSSGYPQDISATFIEKTVYVNGAVDSDAEQDGSVLKPYKNIQQALGRCNKYYDVLTINIADGTYIPYEENSQKNIIKISSFHGGRIKLVGNTTNPENVVLQSIVIENANVDINGLTVKTDGSYYDGIAARYSKVGLNKVNIGDSSNTTHYSAVTATQSEIYAIDCVFSYQKNGFVLTAGSYAFVLNSTYDHITESYMNANNSHYNTRNITTTNSTPAFFPIRRNQNSPIPLTATEFETEYTSTVPLNNFGHVRIYWRTNDYDAGVIDIPVASGSTRNYELYQKFFNGSGTEIYEKCARVSVNASNDKISLSRKHDITTVVSTGNKTYSVPDHNYYITRVEGITNPIY